MATVRSERGACSPRVSPVCEHKRQEAFQAQTGSRRIRSEDCIQGVLALTLKGWASCFASVLGISVSRMLRVTLDTNILPANDLMAAVPAEQFEFGVVTVTDREIGAASGKFSLLSMASIPETAVWDESTWDAATWSADDECLERVLQIISDGSFPSLPTRESLTPGQLRQLRDGMIFCAHVRTQREIFVTNDERAFVRKTKRETLEQLFATRIMTKPEFVQEFAARDFGALRNGPDGSAPP